MKFITGFVIGAASVTVLSFTVYYKTSPFIQSLKKSANDGLEKIKSRIPKDLKIRKQEENCEENEVKSSKIQKIKERFGRRLKENNELETEANSLGNEAEEQDSKKGILSKK